jgi:CDP-glycerol glycerophosphotransferase (TagB/SpsB family)
MISNDINITMKANKKGNNLKIIDIRYWYSFKYEIIKIEYNIGLYDKEENLISPSNISLYGNISIICNIEIVYYNISIDSLANIKGNKYFNCIEFFNMNERVALGIKIYNIDDNNIYNYILLFTDEFINYNIIGFNLDEKFNSIIINNEFNLLLKNINTINNKLNESYKLKSSYIQYPINSLKRNCNLEESAWKFVNIFGIYFCFCKGKKCLESNIIQQCKFNFYINIIDENRDLYLKTDYLFVDFIFSEISSDDAYPVFEEMEKQKYPAHYITEKKDIYQKYCNKESKCLKILLITKSNYLNDGDFLQNYFGLILKLKAFISAKPWCTNNIAELFYNIEYITYIALGHGICYFKDYLYKKNRLYGSLKNDKIVIPPSKKIIFIAKKYGWKDENIIKINLPRWDKYNNKVLSNINNNKYSTQSILFMFTWRAIKIKKNISYYYINNIISLLINSDLKKTLSQTKITLYFTFHRYIIDKYKTKFEEIISNNKYIYYLDQNEISDCLSKIGLVVSDFSSIIFDSIYRRKPFIIYIPDANDNNIKNIYDDDYYQLIESLKNGTMYFENKFFNINSVIEKIIFYINNNFTLEKNLVKFYDSFELNQNTNTNINNFIKYLNNLK